MATLFATRPQVEIPYYEQSDKRACQVACAEKQDNGVFGVGSEGWTAIFTAVLAISTCILVCVSSIQIRYLIKADETARIAADSTGTLADAATASAALAKSTPERQLRAYVHVETIIAYGLKSGRSPKIEIKIKNFGQTPARNLINNYRFEIFKNPTLYEFGLLSGKRGEIADIGPTQRDNFVISIDRREWWDIKEPDVLFHSHVLYVFGCFNYTDAFDQRRSTEYRQRLRPSHGGIEDKEFFIVESTAGNRTT